MTAMMAPFYEILNSFGKMVGLKRELKEIDTQKYITSLFFAYIRRCGCKFKKTFKNI